MEQEKNHQESRKTIEFDLDTNLAQKAIGSKTKPYYDIKKFLCSHGFDCHVQGSVYESREPMSLGEVRYICDQMNKQIGYLKDCVRDIRTKDVPVEYSLNDIFQSEQEPESELKHEIEEEPNPKSLDQLTQRELETLILSRGDFSAYTEGGQNSQNRDIDRNDDEPTR
ncbi:MAG: hypothetical protein K2H53_02550 [Clostridia bacterium]|nr:hypothetical protein [Clostridia bacterium]